MNSADARKEPKKKTPLYYMGKNEGYILQKSEWFPQIMFSLSEENSARKKSIHYISTGWIWFINVIYLLKNEVKNQGTKYHICNPPNN